MKRFLAGALVVAAVVIVLPSFVIHGHPTSSPVVRFGPAAAWVAGLVCLVLTGVGGGRARPPGFVVRPDAPSFAVPASRAFGLLTVALVLLAANLTGPLVSLWVHPDFTGTGGSVGLVVVVGESACTAVGALVLVRLVSMVFRGTPMLELTPVGLVVHGLVGTHVFLWDALRPGTPARGYDLVKLVVDRPELLRRGARMRPSRRITMQVMFVHPWFFTDAVRLYVLRPERRAAIGTPEEYTRLLVDLGVLVPIT